jgi:lysophospholipase L1-like esterase
MPTAYGVSNCVGWYQASAGLYSDAGSTPAVQGGGVAQWNDCSGAGNHLTQTTAANQPVFNNYTAVVGPGGPADISPFGAAINTFQPSYPAAVLFDGVNGFLNMPSSLAVPGSGCTVVLCAKGVGVSPVALGPGSTGGIFTFGYFGGSPQKMGYYNGNYGQFPTSTYVPVMCPMVYGVRVSAAFNETRLYMGTNQQGVLSGNALPSGLAGGSIGRAANVNSSIFGNFSFNGEIAEVAVFSTALADGDMANLLADMQAANRLRVDSNASQVIFVGDSLTAGGPSLHPVSKNYPAILVQQAGGAFKPLTIAVPGNTIAQQMTYVTNQVLPLDLTPFGKNVAVICCGSNDIIANRTSAQILADLATLGTALRAGGFKVIMLTITPRTLPTGQAAVLTAVNAGLRTGYTAFADALVDWAADPRLSDPTNTIYYSDACHTTDIGDGVKAQLVQPVLNSILNPAATTATPLEYASFYAPGRTFLGNYGTFVRS